MAKLGLRMVLESAETRSYFAAWQLAVDQIRVDVIRHQLQDSRVKRMLILRTQREQILEAKELHSLVVKLDPLQRVSPESALARGVTSRTWEESSSILLLAAALRISRAARGLAARQLRRQVLREQAALVVIARCWRAFLMRRCLQLMVANQRLRRLVRQWKARRKRRQLLELVRDVYPPSDQVRPFNDSSEEETDTGMRLESISDEEAGGEGWREGGRTSTPMGKAVRSIAAGRSNTTGATSADGPSTLIALDSGEGDGGADATSSYDAADGRTSGATASRRRRFMARVGSMRRSSYGGAGGSWGSQRSSAHQFGKRAGVVVGGAVAGAGKLMGGKLMCRGSGRASHAPHSSPESSTRKRGASSGEKQARASSNSTGRSVGASSASFRDVQALDKAIRSWADLVVSRNISPKANALSIELPSLHLEAQRRLLGSGFAATGLTYGDEVTALVRIQKHARGRLALRRYHHVVHALVRIQKHSRGRSVRRRGSACIKGHSAAAALLALPSHLCHGASATITTLGAGAELASEVAEGVVDGAAHAVQHGAELASEVAHAVQHGAELVSEVAEGVVDRAGSAASGVSRAVAQPLGKMNSQLMSLGNMKLPWASKRDVRRPVVTGSRWRSLQVAGRMMVSSGRGGAKVHPAPVPSKERRSTGRGHAHGMLNPHSMLNPHGMLGRMSSVSHSLARKRQQLFHPYETSLDPEAELQQREARLERRRARRAVLERRRPRGLCTILKRQPGFRAFFRLIESYRFWRIFPWVVSVSGILLANFWTLLYAMRYFAFR